MSAENKSVLTEVQEICEHIGVVYQGGLQRVGTLDELRISDVHRVDARVTHDLDRAELERVPGVADVEIAGHRLQCTVTGAMGPLLTVLEPAQVVSLDSSAMSLEEVFLSQYGKPE